MSKSRKHGIFAVSGDVVVLSTKNNEEVRNAITVEIALETVFKQMEIGGNRERTIQSYAYIFKQLVEENKLKYVEDNTIDSIYHYLDAIDVSQRTKLIHLKSVKAVLSNFYNNDWFSDRF